MRIPKYQAWHKANKQLYTVAVLYPDAHMVMLYSDKSMFSASFAEIELREFIGLTDKNGKDIFEGDIVKFLNCATGKELLRQCKWDTKYPAFVFCHLNEQSSEDIGGWRFLKYLEETGSTMEIIGNVYQNPELLRAQEKNKRRPGVRGIEYNKSLQNVAERRRP